MAQGTLIVLFICLSHQIHHAVAPPPPTSAEIKHRHQSVETLEAIVSETRQTDDKSATSKENESMEKQEKEEEKSGGKEDEGKQEEIQRSARETPLNLGLFEPAKRQIRAPQMIDFISAGGQSWSPARPIYQRHAFPEDENNFMKFNKEHSKRESMQPMAFPFRIGGLDPTGTPINWIQQTGSSSAFPQNAQGMNGFHPQPFLMASPQMLGLPQNLQMGGQLPQGFSGFSSLLPGSFGMMPSTFTATTGFSSMPNHFSGTGLGATSSNQFGGSAGYSPMNQFSSTGFGMIPNQWMGSSFNALPSQFGMSSFGQQSSPGTNQAVQNVGQSTQQPNNQHFPQGNQVYTQQPLNNQIPSFEQTTLGRQGFRTLTGQTPPFQTQEQVGNQNTPLTQPQGTPFPTTSVPSFLQQQNATSPLSSQVNQRHTLPQPTVLRRPVFLAGQRSSQNAADDQNDDEATVEVDYEAEGAERKN